jgi:hypothetical protein
MRFLSLILTLPLAFSGSIDCLLAQQPPPPPPTEEAVPESPPEAAAGAPESEKAGEAAPEAHKSGAALKGKVVGADRRKPVEGARVHAVRRGGETYSSAPADAKGRYRLEGLPPGTYKLVVSVDDGLYAFPGDLGITSIHDFGLDLALVPAEGAVSEEIPGVSGTPRGIAYLAQGGNKAGPATFWKSAGGITLLVVSAGAIAYILSREGGSDQESMSISPSAP